MQRGDSAKTPARSAWFVVMLVLLGAACSQSPSGSDGFTTSTTVSVPGPSVTVATVSTSTTTTTVLATPTTETTKPTDIGDTSEVSGRFRGLPSTSLWKLAEQVATAMDGIDGRDVLGPGETTNFVEEAAFLYRSENRELYGVWFFFNPPDERGVFFSGDPLVEVATEDSAVGPVVVYKARAGSNRSVAPAASMVLVCGDTVQLWVEGEFPRDTRDEVVAVASFVDCVSLDS